LKLDFIFMKCSIHSGNGSRARLWAAASCVITLAAGLLSFTACSRTPPPAAVPPDGGDAQRLVALVDYIGGDYGGAVQGGRVLDEGEFAEQLKFAADARALTEGLVAGKGGGPRAASPRPAPEPLVSAVIEIETLVQAKADPETVQRACRAAREAAIARFGLQTMPSERPNLPSAQALYAQSCATCHGATGNADTEKAKTLDPMPARFKDPHRLGELSPYRIYNALTFGVPGTAMASFEALTPSERWSLAFFVFRLGHEGEPVGAPVAITLADMALKTDREVRETLARDTPGDASAALVWVRREAAFTEPPAGAGIDKARSLVRHAVDTYAAGRMVEADRLCIDAYLQGFEPLEPRLRARDAAGTREVESAFHALRAAMARQETADRVRARGQALDRRIAGLGESGRPIVPFAAAFLIYLREGTEAALLVGALLAGLRRLGRADAARYIHGGWLLALPAGVATWFLFDRAISLGADQRELMEGVVALAAAAVLFSVSFWMISKVESRHWMGYLRQQLEAGLSRRSLYVLSGLAFLAVYREAAETILFTQALMLESEAHRAEVFSGALAGLLAVVVIAIVMNRTVLRLPLGPFFAVSSLLLCGLAVSFAGAGMYELVAAGYLRPRPVAFPEIPWMGIYPDLTGLLVQLTIVLVIAGAGLATLMRRPVPETGRSAS
jgi:high-affinity iron transporter